MNRRSFIATAAVAPVAAVAGCLGSDDPVRWTHDVAHAVAPPTVVDGTVYAGTQSGLLYAVDTDTGDTVVDDPIAIGSPDSPGQVRSAVTVLDGTIYLGTYGFDRRLLAIDAEDGSERWDDPVETAGIRTAPTVLDGVCYASDRDGTLHAVDATTGEPRWDGTPSIESAPASSLAVMDGTVVVATQTGTVSAFDAATGETVWTEPYQTGEWISYSGPVVSGETVFVGDDHGQIHAIDLTSGSPAWDAPFQTIDWPERFGQISTIPTVSYGTVYATTDDALFAMDADDGSVYWTEPYVPERSARFQGAPTVADRAVFVGSTQGIHAVHADTAEPVWDEPVETRGTAGAPIVVDGTLFTGTDGNRLYAISTDAEGSSDDARVVTGLLGHHDTWAGHQVP